MIGKFNITQWAIFCAIVVLPITWLKSMREISFVSFFGVISCFVTMIVTTVLGLQRYFDPEIQERHSHSMFKWYSFPMAFASMVFAYGGHSAFPAIADSMKSPHRFNLVFDLAYLIVLILYVPVAIVGYLVYGNVAQSPILLSLPHGIPSIVANAFITFHVLCAFPLTLNPIFSKFEQSIRLKQNYGWKTEIMIRIIYRTFVVIFSLTIALLVPFFADFMSLLGSISSFTMVFVFPCIFYMILYNGSIGKLEYSWILFLFVCGLAGSFFGAITSLKTLYYDLFS